MFFIKIFSKNNNNGKKYVCGVEETQEPDVIQSVGLFFIKFNKETKTSCDKYYKDYEYEEMEKEEEETYIGYLKSLKKVEGKFVDPLRKMIKLFNDEDLLGQEKDIYDCLYFLITSYLKEEGINQNFIIKENNSFFLVTKIEESDCINLKNLRIIRLPENLKL